MHHLVVTRPPPQVSSHKVFTPPVHTDRRLGLIKARVASSASDPVMRGDTGSSLKSVWTYPKWVKVMLFPWNDFQICSRAKRKPQYPGTGL